MSKATQLSNAPHIIYDGYSSRLFGIENVQPSNGLAQEIFIANTSLVTDQSRYNDRVFLLGRNREPLEFSMRLLFNPHTFDERKLQDLKRWLYQDTYKPFRYDTGEEKDLDIWVYAICTGESKVMHNAIDDAYIDFNFSTNAPYRFSQVMEDEFDFSVSNTEKMTQDFNDGFAAISKAMESLASRLRQSITNTSDITNRYPDEYRKLINPFIADARLARDHINSPFAELAKVKGAVSNYRTQWNNQRTLLNTVLSDMEILWKRIQDLGYSYLNGTPNLYSKALSNPNTRLHTNGDEVYTTWYTSSDFITKTTGKYIWHSNKTIEIPIVHFYDSVRQFISGKQLTAGSTLTIDEFPEGTEYFKIGARVVDFDDSRWKLEVNSKNAYTASPYDLFPEVKESTIVDNVSRLNEILFSLDSIQENVINYVKNISNNIDNTLELYPDIVTLHNFGDLPAKPTIEIEVVDPVDIRIENLDTGESTTIIDNVPGEKIILKNESEQIHTSRLNYYKYDSHDDNFITLREFENRLQFYGSFKVKITYQFKIL